MEEQVDKIAKYLLIGYSEDFVRDFYPLLEAWPDKNECRRVLRQTHIYSRFKDIRFIGPDEMITMDYRADRLNISFDKENKITKIDVG